MVVAVGGSPQVPASQAISAGNDVELLLEFTPASYIVTDDDLTVDNESVTVSIVEGSTDLIKLSVAPDAPAGETFAVKFRQQTIINGSVTSAKVWPSMILPVGDIQSDWVHINFDMPEFDESTNCIVKLTGNDYDLDLSFSYGNETVLTCRSDDLPDDLKPGIEMTYDAFRGSVTWMEVENGVSHDYTFTVLSLDHNGAQVYP